MNKIIFYGNGIVWHPIQHCVLCTFINGMFETSDQETIDLLIDLGYKHDGKFESLETVCNEFEEKLIKEVEAEVKKPRRKKE